MASMVSILPSREISFAGGNGQGCRWCSVELRKNIHRQQVNDRESSVRPAESEGAVSLLVMRGITVNGGMECT